MVYRVYVEKLPEYAVQADSLTKELQNLLGIRQLTRARILNRYDVEGISKELFTQSVQAVFSEPPLDTVSFTLPQAEHLFAVEYLPGQFDQRAESAAECIQLISQQERPVVKSAKVYLLEGTLTPSQVQEIQKYVVNPVEARLASLDPRETLAAEYPQPQPVEVLEGFLSLKPEEFPGFVEEYGLAMNQQDLAFCQHYFQQENRNPTITELRMIDTYWSDHCRHTTFSTILEDITVQDGKVQKAYEAYTGLRQALSITKPQTLMDIATIGAKALKADGRLKGMDESEEINACSVHLEVDNNGQPEDWLLLFKNETHNHPTEIEPFGGAATCIGGAIRDPLANRGYVFGAMRVTGAADPLVPVQQTMEGKLPQRKLVTTAADGYSSYGNQIGLATGQVTELYHPGYMAKRMEIGAVLGAVPLKNVRRETPQPGDVVILVGGRTGRDGCGGATGSSKAHKVESLETCGAEVQKGNPPVERKLQRLFRNPAASALILRCNDFGAGGVSVAIGELADGLRIQLDAVPKKYDGLDATELAISESQERMAVVVNPQDQREFIRLATLENLEATPVAVVTAEPRLVMEWNGRTVVNLSRDFLNSNGAKQFAAVHVPAMPTAQWEAPAGDSFCSKMETLVSSLNGCAQKGLGEQFDSTIGAGTLLMPFGGKYLLTPAQAMAMKIPVEDETTTCSGMAFGGNPYILEQNPFEGAALAVVESVAKLAASGFSSRNMYLTFQEYFERLRQEPIRWGKPFSALLGALEAQMALGIASIGGKDSMSGSFEDLDVPPTLVSFAVAGGRCEHITSPECKLPHSQIVWLRPETNGLCPEYSSFQAVLNQLETLIQQGKALAVRAVGAEGPAYALFQMCLGNRLGAEISSSLSEEQLYQPGFGSFLVELESPESVGQLFAITTPEYTLRYRQEFCDLAALQKTWLDKLEPVFPLQSPSSSAPVEKPLYLRNTPYTGPAIGTAKPKAFIPVFPGTNCEYDTARALRRAGADPVTLVLNNLTPTSIAESSAEMARLIRQSQMIVLPGGFSGGDEPEGSAKLITAFFRGPEVSEAVRDLLDNRDGLMLGICNGFQALIKLGLLPFGKITAPAADSPTLTFNAISRHQSMLVHTRIASNLSPWLMHEKPDSIHTVAVSHGEGRFIAPESTIQALATAGQIATQYVDFAGNPSMEIQFNPNGSSWAVEGISSPDGRVLGKMGHSERSGAFLYGNVPGNSYQKIMEGGVDYFRL